MKKRLLAALVGGAMLAGSLAGGTVLAEETVQTGETVDFGTTITDFRVGDSRYLIYYPAPNAAETLAVSTTCTAPIFIVYPDKNVTDDEAVAYAEETGLAQLAADNGSVVCFVEPMNGESWTEEDQASYASLIQSFTDSSSLDVINGVAHDADFMTGQSISVLIGSAQRVYVYGDGTGADFVADTLLQPTKVMAKWGFETDATVAGATLVGATDASGVQKNDIPVVSVGADEALNTVLEENCGQVLTLDEADFVRGFEELTGKYRREDNHMIAIHDREAEGIVEEIRTASVKVSEDDAAANGAEEKEVNYVLCYDENLDVTNGNVPLLFAFYGGGNTALYLAESSEWPEIGQKNGFMTVLVDDHVSVTPTEVIDLLGQLEEEFSIDASRVYATGFSMGSAMTWNLMEQYPTVFAAYAPMHGSFMPGDAGSDEIMPVFFVGGENTPLVEFPSQGDQVLERIVDVFDQNRVEKEYQVSLEELESWENPLWGVNGDIVYQVNDEEKFTESVLTVNLFQSEDGKYYTALANSSNQGHQILSRNCWAAWDFMSQFSRGEDGSVVIEETAYSMPSADGSVADNSYNTAE